MQLKNDNKRKNLLIVENVLGVWELLNQCVICITTTLTNSRNSGVILIYLLNIIYAPNTNNGLKNEINNKIITRIIKINK